MIEEIAGRVGESRRYRHVDGGLVRRLAAEEASRSRNVDEAVKRVKRRLHQAVGAFETRGTRSSIDRLAEAWTGDLRAAGFRDACRAVLAAHASTAERAPHVEVLGAVVGDVVAATRARSVVDLGCGIGPVGLPWYGLPTDAHYAALDVDRRALETVRAFLELVGQPHEVREQDLVADPSPPPADVALLLKLVTTLDRQDPDAAERVIRRLRAPIAIISFPARSLGGRRSLESAYRRRMEELRARVADRVERIEEASVPNELVYVLTLAARDG